MLRSRPAFEWSGSQNVIARYDAVQEQLFREAATDAAGREHYFDEALHHAIVEDNRDYWFEHLKPNTPKAKIRNANHRGWTNLMFAAVEGHLELCHYLLMLGHDKEEISMGVDGTTVFNIALKNDEIFQLYLDFHPEACIRRLKKNGKTVLHLTTEAYDRYKVWQLLEAGCPSMVKDGKGNTPLHVAIVKEDWTLVRILLEYGGWNVGPLIQNNQDAWFANIKLMTECRNENGLSPLSMMANKELFQWFDRLRKNVQPARPPPANVFQDPISLMEQNLRSLQDRSQVGRYRTLDLPKDNLRELCIQDLVDQFFILPQSLQYWGMPKSEGVTSIAGDSWMYQGDPADKQQCHDFLQLPTEQPTSDNDFDSESSPAGVSPSSTVSPSLSLTIATETDGKPLDDPLVVQGIFKISKQSTFTQSFTASDTSVIGHLHSARPVLHIKTPIPLARSSMYTGSTTRISSQRHHRRSLTTPVQSMAQFHRPSLPSSASSAVEPRNGSWLHGVWNMLRSGSTSSDAEVSTSPKKTKAEDKLASKRINYYVEPFAMTPVSSSANEVRVDIVSNRQYASNCATSSSASRAVIADSPTDPSLSEAFIPADAPADIPRFSGGELVSGYRSSTFKLPPKEDPYWRPAVW